MANSDQVKVLIRSDADSCGTCFYAIAMQVPAWNANARFAQGDKE